MAEESALRGNRFVALITSALILLTGLAGCTGHHTATQSSKQVSGLPVLSDARAQFEQAVGKRLDGRGLVTEDLAVDVFSSVVGPLPGWNGIPLPHSEAGTVGEAVGMIVGFLPQLPPAQRQAVQDYVAAFARPAADDVVLPSASGTATHAGGPVGGIGPVAVAVPADYHRQQNDPPSESPLRTQARQLAGRALGFVGTRLGRQIDDPRHPYTNLPIHITFLHTGDVAPDGRRMLTAGTYALTVPVPQRADDHLVWQIWLVINESVLNVVENRALAATVYHEMFHAFMYDSNEFREHLNLTDGMPEWLKEGSAEWVGQLGAQQEDGSGFDESGADYWNQWAGHPDVDLLHRRYDALGFFSLLQQADTDPWTLFGPMFHNPGAALDTALAAARHGRADVMTLWTTSIHQLDGDARYRPAGPGMPPVGAGGLARPRADVARATVGGGPWHTSWPGVTGAHLVTVDASGAFLMRVSTAGVEASAVVMPTDVAAEWPRALTGTLFCMNAPGTCECPNHTTPAGLEHDITGSPGEVSISVSDAHAAASEMTVELISRDQACGGPTPQPGPTSAGPGGRDGGPLADCLIGSWVSDPMDGRIASQTMNAHLTGADGLKAEFDHGGKVSWSADGSHPMIGNFATRAGSSALNAVATVTMTGTATGTWSPAGGSITTAGGTGGIHVVETVTVGGQTIPVLDRSAPDALGSIGQAVQAGSAPGGTGSPPAPVTTSMTCDARHWTVSHQFANGTLVQSWHRV